MKYLENQSNPSYLFTHHPLVPYWNAAVRLGFFLIVTLTLSLLYRTQERQEELMAFLVHDLRAPLVGHLG
jgi:hypothetical protein